MDLFERQVIREQGSVSIRFAGSEGVFEALELRKEIYAALSDPSVESLDLDCTQLKDFDASLLQLLISSVRVARELQKSLQIVCPNRDLLGHLAAAGIAVPASESSK